MTTETNLLVIENNGEMNIAKIHCIIRVFCRKLLKNHYFHLIVLGVLSCLLLAIDIYMQINVIPMDSVEEQV